MISRQKKKQQDEPDLDPHEGRSASELEMLKELEGIEKALEESARELKGRLLEDCRILSYPTCICLDFEIRLALTSKKARQFFQQIRLEGAMGVINFIAFITIQYFITKPLFDIFFRFRRYKRFRNILKRV